MADERLHKLEENLTFVERSSEESLAQIVDLDRRLRALIERVARIEGRLIELRSPDAGGADSPDAQPDDPSPESH